MTVSEIRAVAKRGTYLSPKEYQRQINFLLAEKSRIEASLAETERLWRQERLRNRAEDEDERIG